MPKIRKKPTLQKDWPIICSRCNVMGEELQILQFEFLHPEDGVTTEKLGLCDKCGDQFRKWMWLKWDVKQ